MSEVQPEQSEHQPEQQRPTRNRRWAVLVAAVLVLGLGARLADRNLGSGDPEGVPGSSYTTGATGLAAYADLLADRGHRVTRVREALADADLDPRTTLVVAGAGDVREDRDAVAAFVRAGGRLVLIGQLITFQLGDLADPGPDWVRIGTTTGLVQAPSPETGRVREVRGSGAGSWVDTGALLPVVGDGTRSLVAVGNVGAGRIVAIADEGILQNDRLAEADNAALGIDVVGADGRPVHFAEAHLGHGGATGLNAIPTSWRWLLVGLLAATLVGFWSRGKRLGPAQRPERVLSPPRADTVHALALTLSRTGELGPVAERLRRAGRDRLARRAGLPADADDSELRAAANRSGLAPEETDALLAPDPQNHHQDHKQDPTRALLAAGAALARLEGDRS